jgi:hypothetical protein
MVDFPYTHCRLILRFWPGASQHRHFSLIDGFAEEEECTGFGCSGRVVAEPALALIRKFIIGSQS